MPVIVSFTLTLIVLSIYLLYMRVQQVSDKHKDAMFKNRAEVEHLSKITDGLKYNMLTSNEARSLLHVDKWDGKPTTRFWKEPEFTGYTTEQQLKTGDGRTVWTDLPPISESQENYQMWPHNW